MNKWLQHMSNTEMNSETVLLIFEMSLDLWWRTGLPYQELLIIIFWSRDVKTGGFFDWINFAILD